MTRRTDRNRMVKALVARMPQVSSRWLRMLLLSCAFAGPSGAQDVQTGHYAPGWDARLRAGTMPKDPGWYFLNTTMYFNAARFKDGSGNTSSNDRTDYLLTALAISWRPDFQLFGGDYMAVVTPAVGNLSGLPILVEGQPEKPNRG